MRKRAKLLSIDPRYRVDYHLNRALTFGLYSLLRISQVFHADWSISKRRTSFGCRASKGRKADGSRFTRRRWRRWGRRKNPGRIFDYWETLPAFREAVYKKAKRERLYGVRFHETKHTGFRRSLKLDTRSRKFVE